MTMAMSRSRTPLDIAIVEQLHIRESRESFYAYRRYLHPKLKDGWFVRSISWHLQVFYDDLIAGRKPKLAIEAPPQHGKSSAIVDFITWIAGKHPEFRTIYTSFSERLGVRANLSCQRIYDSKKYKYIFPETRIATIGAKDQFGATRNRELLEYIDKDGYFRNTTVRGSITGESLDLGIIDDPLKGREQANSETIRDATWDWLTDDFMTRFSEDAGLLMIMTRWHIDDPLSRLKEQVGDGLKVVKYQAIAENDERHRNAGDPLFPEHKSLQFLHSIKKTMATSSWLSLYQQNPQIMGGEIIKGSWFGYWNILPKLEYRMIYADTAQKTKERNDFSVFECWGKGDDGKIYLLDILRGKWEAPELERRAVAFWNKHKAQDCFEMGRLRKMKVEDKSSGTGLIQGIKKKKENPIPIDGIERVTDKYTRVLDVLGFIENGWVLIPEGAPFVNDFITECEAFTADDSHLHDDQIDPMVDAINDMIGTGSSSINTWSRLGKQK